MDLNVDKIGILNNVHNIGICSVGMLFSYVDNSYEHQVHS